MIETALPLMRTERVSKRFPDGQVDALVDVDLEVWRGDYAAIMGPSGSGKSTLLTMLGALDRPTSGAIYFGQEALAEMANLDRFRAAKLGFVFQSFHLLPTLTALENVQLPMFEIGLARGERVARAEELLQVTSIEHRARHLPRHLSVGERQRVAIARALANRPALLLADEPTGNLDSQTAEEILQLFERLHRDEAMTIVVVTHSREVAERTGRIIRLHDGRIVEDRRT